MVSLLRSASIAGLLVVALSGCEHMSKGFLGVSVDRSGQVALVHDCSGRIEGATVDYQVVIGDEARDGRSRLAGGDVDELVAEIGARFRSRCVPCAVSLATWVGQASVVTESAEFRRRLGEIGRGAMSRPWIIVGGNASDGRGPSDGVRAPVVDLKTDVVYAQSGLYDTDAFC